jgi:putative transposase
MKTQYDPKIHHRRSIRLKGYDYSSAGAYFVTIVTQGRATLFGEVVNGEMRLNRCGTIVQKWWDTIPDHFPNVETGAFVVMPNHVHGIIVIDDPRRGTVPVPPVPVPQSDKTYFVEGPTTHSGGGTPPRQEPKLGQIVAYFKYKSTKEINAIQGGVVTRLWQRNYYEHIIRNQQDLELTWLYIESNPAQWQADDENPARGPLVVESTR